MGHRLATAGRSRDQAALARRLPSSLTLGRALRNIGPRRRVRRLVRRSLGGGGSFSEGGSLGEVGTQVPYKVQLRTLGNLGVEKTDTLVDVGVYRVVRLGEVARGKESVTNMFHVVLANGIGKYRKQILNAEA